MVTGTPDWQKVTQVTDNPILNLRGIAFSGGQERDSGWIAVSSWQSLRLACSFDGGYGTVLVEFAEATVGPNTIYSKTWDIIVGTGVNVLMPVFGKYVKVTVTNTSSGSGIVNALAGMNMLPVRNITYLDEPSAFISVNSKSLAHSTSILYFPPNIVAGPAFLDIHLQDTSGKLNFAVNQYDYTQGEVTGIGFWPGPTSDIWQTIALPSVLWALHVTNTDTSSGHTFSAYIVPAGL